MLDNDTDSEPPNVAKRPIYAVFEGGGAKGTAHIGALQAVEDNGLDIIGVAGTSAGALIAVLAAVGLESSDIMSATDPTDNLLARSQKSPVDLLGKSGWKRLQQLLRGGPKLAKWIAFCGGILSFPFAPRSIWTAIAVYRRLGHFTTSEIQEFINLVIRDRLKRINEEAGLGWEVPEIIRFRDLALEWPTVVPLKIIVTDVDRGRLEILDAESAPDVVVAEAVAASISIPLAFEPAAIPSFREGRFADGGLVSNLPIWAFSEEKLCYEREHFLRPPVPIVGFSLRGTSEDSEEQRDNGFASYVMRLVSAALQGSQETAHRFLDDVLIVPLRTDLKFLDFDVKWETFRDAREQGRKSADRNLRFALAIKPDRIRTELVSLRDAVLEVINKRRRKFHKAKISQLRVNLIRPFGLRSLRVMESLNMETDADDRLLLDRRGSVAAEAFRSRGLRVFWLKQGFEDQTNEFMTKYERAMVRTTVRSVACVPIFEDLDAWDLDEPDRPEPSGVLAVDSDKALASYFDNHEIRDMLVKQSAVLYEAVSAEMDDGQDRDTAGI